jgi:ABC-type antimicrobial peptide transport system permease subunit
MIISTLVGVVSFAANVQENAMEHGALRSIGLTEKQTLRMWVMEALALVLSSFFLGSIIGILVACSLTLTQGLFLEQPFTLNLPGELLFCLFCLCCGVAVFSSWLPAQALNQRPISSVLKG